MGNEKMEPRMDTKEREEAARYALQCRKASLEELRAMAEETKGMNREKLIMNRDEKFEERMKNVAWLLGFIRGKDGKNERKESAGTQLALQDAEEAEARTREERDKLRGEVERLSRANAELAAKNVELREQIRELEHEKHCETLRAEALAVSRDKWKASSEAMAEALAAVKERTGRAERTEGTEGGSGGNAEASL